MGLATGFRAWLITVGNEILIGRVVNTNLTWLGRKLTLLGYDVHRGLIVPDEIGDIAWAFKTALSSDAKVIISTGGLGPTFDDKTLEGLACALGVELELNEEALEMIRGKYEGRGLKLTEHRVKMAKLPRGARPIPNPAGTAPGVHIELQGKHVFALPGVPKEMKAIFETHLEPLLKRIGPAIYFAERFLISKGIPESSAAPLIEEAMKLGRAVYIKSHPKFSELEGPVLELHVTASARSREEAERDVERVTSKLRELLSRHGGRVYEVGSDEF